jgi:DUF4097 and DUF4098 domain-containing protein YvlB
MRIKRAVVFAVIFSFSIFLLGLAPTNLLAKDKYEEKFSKTVSLAKDGKVILTNISGDIEVKTWNKGEVQIKALKTTKTSSEAKAKENFQKVKIEITQEGGTLRIETKYPKDFFRSRSTGVSVDYWLTIPSQAYPNIKSVSGDISLESIGASAKAETVSGDVDLLKIAGAAKAESVSGDVTVTGVKKGVDANSVSGDLEIVDVVGDADLKTVSGEITAKNILSGSVEYTGDILDNGNYQIKSHSGPITLVIPAGSGFSLEAKTFSGEIYSDFDIKISGKLSKKAIQGTVNGGGAEIELKTFSGNIYLKKR